MRVLVTGGTGHLGGAVAARLMRDGEVVRILARRPRADPGIEWIAGDLATLTTVELMDEYLRARSITRRIRRAPLPRRLERAITAGNTSPDALLGTTTWAQWLSRE